MKFYLLLLPIAALSLAFLQVGARSTFAVHEKALKSAQSLKLTFTIQQLPGTPAEAKLTLSRPGMMKLDTPSRLVVSDGRSLWDLDKASNTYTESPIDSAGLATKLAEDLTWAWSAFLSPDQFKTARAADAGSKRMIRGNAVTAVSLTLEGDKTAQFYFDPKLGFARGASIKTFKGEFIVLATEVALGTQPISPLEFAFVPPAGAKKSERPKSDLTSYVPINAIFMGNCMPCHGANRKGGLNLTSYGSLMNGGNGGQEVIPGNGKGSPLVQYLTGERMPRMPYMKPALRQALIDQIVSWIDAGAKQ